jgi:hypothetical protein
MPHPPVPALPAAPASPRQAAFNALKAVLNNAEAAMNNPANTQAAQATARALWTETGEQLDALDQAQIADDSVALQAGAAEMTPGMEKLKALKEKISALGNDLKEAASILTGIDKAIAELRALGPF